MLLILVALALVVVPVFINTTWAVTGTIWATPPRINLTNNTTITFAFAGCGCTPGTPHTFRITVTKPGGVGVSYTTVSVLSNSTGGGVGATTYPGPGWILVSGSGANTDVSGIYNVVLDKTAPNPNQNGVASATFEVTSALTVTILSPTGLSYTRGDTVTIIGSVLDASGQPVTNAGVMATTPSSTITLSPSLPVGTYSSQYQIQRDDTLGNWNITLTANSPGGNSGGRYYVVSVQPAQLIVSNLATYNSYGVPTSDFSPGDTLYATFQIAYSGSGFLTTGTFDIQVRSPSGKVVAGLQAIYDSNRALFYTPSGFQVSSSDTDGSWQLFIPAYGLSDAYGNTGPVVNVTYRFQIRQSQFVLSQFYLIVAALAAGGGLGGTLLLRRFNTTTAPFESFFKLTGGEMQPPASLLIMGDSGAGATTLGLQLLYRDLTAGKFCGLLSYDSFPSEIKRRMRDMGWDVTTYLERGQLKILDCYSALAGIEGALIKDPTDFTEVSIQVTGMIEKSKGPATILMDSVTPIFNSAAAKDCINFLQVIGAKVKNSGGMFIFTANKGSIPEDARFKVESLADGVVELSMIRKAKTLARSLQVKKISGRESTSTETEFAIVAGKGILFKKQRIPIGILQPK